MESQITIFNRDLDNGRLTFETTFPEDYRKARFEFISDRNKKITSLMDVSPFDPDRTPGETRWEKNSNIWFPVVDLELEPGMYAKVRIDGADYCRINSYFNFDTTKVTAGQARFDPECLSHWENGLYLPDKDAKARDFSIVREFYAAPSISHRAFCEVQPLDCEWGGNVLVWYQDLSGCWKYHGSSNFHRKRIKDFENRGAADEEIALNLCIDYLIHSCNHSTGNPYCGGLFLFYDFDGDTYRNGQWPWSWGTAIRFLLECAEMAGNPETSRLVHYSGKELTDLAYRIGLTTLKFQIMNPGHIANHFGTTRYTPRNFSDTGYEELVNTGSDVGFLCGWGWIPLYEATGDERFLHAAENYIAALEPVVKQFVLPPQEWLPGPAEWTDFTIDESGFGTEGIEAVYRVSRDEKYRRICGEYMERHLKIFEREDGLWNRRYGFSDESITPTEYMSRGLGWAMEGLLAAHRCDPSGGKYLTRAVRMADTVIECQRTDGSWGFNLHDERIDVDTADKGTALWSLLLFMLYEETGEERHLKAARAALKWCMDHQYTGENQLARGGIISVSGESGVTYRAYFKMCCQYTTSFMGLALLKNRRIGDIKL